MKFSEVVGQQETCKRLLMQVKEDRVAHAQLFCGVEGCGKFAIALAYASYLLCDNPSDHDICGVCPSCVKTRILEHPDLHFIFPTVKKQTCSSLFKKWKSMIEESPYFTLDTWLEEMSAENQQPVIYSQESDAIQQALMLHSSEGGKKVVIIWLPERMNDATSNKMLKLFEEPPQGTVFILVSDAPEMLLPTVVSRTQRFDVPPISYEDMKEALVKLHGLDETEASRIARQTRGSYAEALSVLKVNSGERQFFDMFVLLMRKAYVRDIKSLLEWSEQIAGWGREKQKSFMAYALKLVRENFMYNFRLPQLNYMNEEEAGFAAKFARFINERNVLGFIEELERTSKDISQNANSSIALFDFTMKVIILLRK